MIFILRKTSFVAVAWLAVAGSVHAETKIITTPRGAKVEVITDYPAGKGPFPVLVLASGIGYDARQPLPEAVSRAVTARGIAVYRFNWAYWLKDGAKGKPSSDRREELEDLQAVIALSKTDPAVDPARLAVGGKSLGSFVAWRAFQADPSIKLSIELTPLCSQFTPPVTDFPGYYTAYDRETRPSLWILGDHDPACAPKTLYGALSTVPGNARVVVLSGNHSFERPEKIPADTQQTVDLAGAIVADYLTTQLGPRP